MLEDQTLIAGWQEIEDELREQWEACWWPKKRDRIWNQLRHLRSMRHKLEVFAGDEPKT